ncbi:MAG: acyltransferase [Lachnospiraceae bacterium]|nr:acyltransferase [Lachnospiraceae bacterium]
MCKEVKNRNASIDGLRAFAIVLIVASHCGFLSQGGVGNAIFFAISGFFAAMPFGVKNVEKELLTFKGIVRYYWKKICRILPVFYAVLFSVYVLMPGVFDKRSLIKNMMFYESYGHLWFLQQEMFMYLCLPLVFCLMYIIKKVVKCKYNDLICAVAVLMLAFLSKKFLSGEILYLVGNGGRQMVRFFQFFIGMSAGYMYRAYLISEKDWSNNYKIRLLADSYNFLFIVFCIISSRSILKYWNAELENYYVGWQMPSLCTSLAAISILVLLVAEKSLFARIMGNRYVAFLGRISFSIYLIHYFIITYLGLHSTIRNMLMVYVASIGVSIILYYLIEKPAVLFAKTMSFKEIKTYYSKLF